MKINQAGIDLVKSFEGVRLAPYRDPVGIPTIGIGATFYEDGRKVAMTDAPISDQRATDLFRFHVQGFEKAVAGMVKVPLNSNQFSALVSFAFNCGEANLKSSTLLKKLNLLDYAGAADEFLKWTKSKGQELPGLVRRRKAERELFLKPEAKAEVQSDSRGLLPDGPSKADMDKILADIEKEVLK